MKNKYFYFLTALSAANFVSADAAFTNDPEELATIFSKDGYFYLVDRDDPEDGIMKTCMRRLIEANKMVIFNKYSAGSIEVALGAGLKMSSYAISQGTEEQFTVDAGYKVTSSEPLVFEVKRNLKDSTLIDRYSYDIATSTITHVKGLDCKNCIGGQKIAFDMSASGGTRYKFCSGPVF